MPRVFHIFHFFQPLKALGDRLVTICVGRMRNGIMQLSNRSKVAGGARSHPSKLVPQPLLRLHLKSAAFASEARAVNKGGSSGHPWRQQATSLRPAVEGQGPPSTCRIKVLVSAIPVLPLLTPHTGK